MAFGSAGPESIYDDVLGAGPLHQGKLRGDVVTTIDPAVQRAAAEGLGGNTGAAVAVDVRSDRIVALMSTPSYDPSLFSGYSTDDAEAWKELHDDQDQPMRNRALREAVTPGRVFHVVVAAAALEKGLQSSVSAPTRSPLRYTPPGSSTVWSGDAAHCENASISTALRYACDNVFARMAVDLGQDALADTARAFGFGEDAPLDVPLRAVPSEWPEGRLGGERLAAAGNGTGGVTATPLVMAGVLAAVANGGERITPGMVSHVVRSDGRVEKPRNAAARGARVLAPDTAAQLRAALEAAPPRGTTGRTAALAGRAEAGAASSVDAAPAAWSVAFTRTTEGRTVTLAARVAVPAAGGGSSADAETAIRVTERMSRAITGLPAS
ncbi:penicillin-binding transpeptidase domain-containing protein [Streptomyces sp. NPDC049837]|uniref:penicillin-binding transpeptidase domain-containing protein n=1 Tax=Streptomyces sp. NPDC049837 TaxID=3155277 RepID=UPI00342CC3A7